MNGWASDPRTLDLPLGGAFSNLLDDKSPQDIFALGLHTRFANRAPDGGRNASDIEIIGAGADRDETEPSRSSFIALDGPEQ